MITHLAWKTYLGRGLQQQDCRDCPDTIFSFFKFPISLFHRFERPPLTDQPNLKHETRFPGATTIVTAINLHFFATFAPFFFLGGIPHRKAHGAPIIGLPLISLANQMGVCCLALMVMHVFSGNKGDQGVACFSTETVLTTGPLYRSSFSLAMLIKAGPVIDISKAISGECACGTFREFMK